MKKYVLKVTSSMHGKGYVKQFYNNYGGCNDFYVTQDVFEASTYDTIEEAKEGIKYCLNVCRDYDTLEELFGDKKSSKEHIKFWADIVEVAITERKVS